MISINGIGTKIYGKDEVEPDGSYITTKWFILLFVPIFPLASYRVWEANVQGSLIPMQIDTSYRMVQVQLNRKQVMKTYLAAATILLIIFGLFGGLLWYFS